MKLTTAELKEFFQSLDDGQDLIFSIVHPKDAKLLQRSVENKVAIITNYPLMKCVAISGGRSADTETPNDRTATIFLVTK